MTYDWILLIGVFLVAALLFRVLLSFAHCIQAVTRWIEHDLKMRRGNRDD